MKIINMQIIPHMEKKTFSFEYNCCNIKSLFYVVDLISAFLNQIHIREDSEHLDLKVALNIWFVSNLILVISIKREKNVN